MKKEQWRRVAVTLVLLTAIADVASAQEPAAVEKIDAPAAWREWAERQRATAEKNKVENDRLRAIYERLAPYVEIRRRLFRESDFDFVESGLKEQFSKIENPMDAMAYSTTIDKISQFNFDTEPEDLRAIMRRWTGERPQSHFAWLVRGHQAITYAWYWRGSGWSSTVTDEGWAHFNAAIDEAAECFEKAYTLEPNDPEIAIGMMTVCMAQSRPRQELEKYFDRAVKIVPAHYRAHSQKFEYLRPSWSGSWPEYRAFLGEIEAKLAKHDDLVLRSVLLHGQFKIEDEMNGTPDDEVGKLRDQQWYDIYKLWVERWPESSAARGFYLVQATTLKKYDEAIAQYEWFGNRYPMDIAWDLPRYHHNRIYRLIMATRKMPEAERQRELDRIIAIDPVYSATYHYIGVLHSNLGEDELAADALRHAIELDPGNGSSFYVLAATYERMGQYEDALAVIQQSKEHDVAENIAAEIAKVEARVLNHVDDTFKPLATPP